MIDKQLNRDIKKYIHEIKSYLICDYKTQKKFIADFKNDVLNYIEDNSVGDINFVYEHFGEPQKIANGFFENSDTKKIKKRMDIGRTIIIGVLAALLIWGVGVTITLIDSHFSYNGYIVEETYNGIPEEPTDYCEEA